MFNSKYKLLCAMYTSTNESKKEKRTVPVLKYYMQITITINSISKKMKIKKGKNGVKQEDNNHKNATRYNKYICVVCGNK